jgi:hypothetical protein
LNPVSPTFHGRDIFAPVAAWLSKTAQPGSFGEEVNDFVRFALPKPKPAGSALKGVVLRVDAFGNLMTNFTAEDLQGLVSSDGKFRLQAGATEITQLVKTFADGAPGEPVALFGSSGYLEIAVNKGSAARTLALQRGAEVTAIPG